MSQIFRTLPVHSPYGSQNLYNMSICSYYFLLKILQWLPSEQSTKCLPGHLILSMFWLQLPPPLSLPPTLVFCTSAIINFEVLFCFWNVLTHLALPKSLMSLSKDIYIYNLLLKVFLDPLPAPSAITCFYICGPMHFAHILFTLS